MRETSQQLKFWVRTTERGRKAFEFFKIEKCCNTRTGNPAKEENSRGQKMEQTVLQGENCGLPSDDKDDVVKSSELGNATPFLCKETGL